MVVPPPPCDGYVGGWVGVTLIQGGWGGVGSSRKDVGVEEVENVVVGFRPLPATDRGQEQLKNIIS